MKFTTDSEQATMQLGASLATKLPPHCVVSLNGTLGAGKSVLVRGFAMGLGIEPDSVTSPTFTLWQTYRGTETLHHLDAYRLDSVDDFYDLGGEELFEMPGFKLIEWGDRISAPLPSKHLRVELAVIDQNTRSVILQPFGDMTWTLSN